MMIKIVLCLVLTAVVARKDHPKFRRNEGATASAVEKVACSGEIARERDTIIEQSKCGEPKLVFEYLKAGSGHEQVSPQAVWVKRCVGLCEYVNEGVCQPTATTTRLIPVRLYDVKTNKETCATYAMEEHVSCGCCALSPGGCPASRVFNPRKCSCQCPNLEERRRCLRKRNQNMRWNRSKCACEVRRRA